MTYQYFKTVFDQILYEKPLPNGDIWYFQRLGNTSLNNQGNWLEILYRTHASYQCNHGHHWQSAWTMIVFRFYLNHSNHCGKVRMKRFGQRCREDRCKEDETYHIGFCPEHEVWWMLQCLLYYIFQRCYERRSQADAENLYYIIPVDNVRGGGRGGTPHPKHCCEACRYNQCQDKFKELRKKA